MPNPKYKPHPRAFSLVEVLLAILILGIGLIMVASVFPVGANWTRQATEESVGQTIAQNAMGVIQTYYGPQGALRNYLQINGTNTVLNPVGGVSPFQLQGVPQFATIPPTMRAYQFGSNNPFPAQFPNRCTYFWTALIRLNPAHDNGSGVIMPAPTYKYDLYILVFRKGAVEHIFSGNAAEVANLRNLPGENYIPSVYSISYRAGQHNPASSPTVFSAIPSVGSYGIGLKSGTVFKQIVDTTVDLTVTGNGGATARPQISNNEFSGTDPIIACPAADGTSASPLIYVYQTTLSL